MPDHDHIRRLVGGSDQRSDRGARIVKPAEIPAICCLGLDTMGAIENCAHAPPVVHDKRSTRTGCHDYAALPFVAPLDSKRSIAARGTTMRLPIRMQGISPRATAS